MRLLEAIVTADLLTALTPKPLLSTIWLFWTSAVELTVSIPLFAFLEIVLAETVTLEEAWALMPWPWFSVIVLSETVPVD